MRMTMLLSLLVLGLVGCQSSQRVTALPEPIWETLPRRPVVRPAPLPPIARQPSAPVAPQAGVAGTVVIDAGHGGHDPGAQGVSPIAEKFITLSIAQNVARLLRDRGARVIMSRDSDRFLSLDERAALAQRNSADLLVSIHADSAQRASASGSTVYIARGASSASRSAGDNIAAALRRAGIECRGVKGAGYRVLIGHTRPAVLVECGFLTNRGDARRLSTASYQGQVAAAIADGICAHLQR